MNVNFWQVNKNKEIIYIELQTKIEMLQNCPSNTIFTHTKLTFKFKTTVRNILSCILHIFNLFKVTVIISYFIRVNITFNYHGDD
jgi:hypothetical protein